MASAGRVAEQGGREPAAILAASRELHGAALAGLRTSRLKQATLVELRLLAAADAEAMFEARLRSAAFLRPHLAWVEPAGETERWLADASARAAALAEHRAFVNETLQAAARGEHIAVGVWAGGLLRGLVEVHGIDLENRRAGFSYWRDDRAPRIKGIMTSAVRRVAQCVLASPALRRLQISVAVSNAASIALADRVGAVREGVLREYEQLHGRWVDHVCFSLLASDSGVRPRARPLVGPVDSSSSGRNGAGRAGKRGPGCIQFPADVALTVAAFLTTEEMVSARIWQVSRSFAESWAQHQSWTAVSVRTNESLAGSEGADQRIIWGTRAVTLMPSSITTRVESLSLQIDMHGQAHPNFVSLHFPALQRAVVQVDEITMRSHDLAMSLQPLRNARELEMQCIARARAVLEYESDADEDALVATTFSAALQLIQGQSFSRLSRLLLQALDIPPLDSRLCAFGLQADCVFLETRSAFAALSEYADFGFDNPLHRAGEADEPSFDIFKLLKSKPTEIVNLGFLIHEQYTRFRELLLPAHGCPNLQSFAMMDSEIDRAKFGELFTYMSKLAPQLATLVITTDSVMYDDADWSIFRELPRSVKNLYLEFDSCGGALISDDVLDMICEHIPSDVSCHIVRRYDDMKDNIVPYYWAIIKGLAELAESNGKLWTHPAFVSGRGRVR
jgi:ribosomal-protein-serine acetyltransferase